MKLLIVDDHAVVREGVAAVLRQAGQQVSVLAAADGTAALATASAHADLDLVFLDLMMPGSDGLATLSAFAAQHPGLPVIVLSSSEQPSDVRAALALGALGYIPKSASPATLLAALKLVLDGEIYVPPFIVTATPAYRDQKPLNGLTERQVAVLKLICSNVANKEIAWQLGIAEKTVKAHVTAIFKALGVSHRAQAISVARDLLGV